jgi:hypothetical protein
MIPKSGNRFSEKLMLNQMAPVVATATAPESNRAPAVALHKSGHA